MIIIYMIVFIIKCLLPKDEVDRSPRQLRNRKQWIENEIRILQEELYTMDPHVSMREMIRDEIRFQLSKEKE